MLAVSALVAVPAVSDRTPFYTKGEPREALVVQTIARGDGFVLPMRNGDEIPSKPPLFHWLAALASRVHGGVTEGPIRFPGLVASLVTVAATAATAWLWWGPATAALSSVVLATSFQWLASSVTARVDMILASTIALALLLFARAIETGRRVPGLAYALVAAATLTKGPIGFVLPCTIALTTLALRGELGFLGWRDAKLLGIAIAVAVLWYLAAFASGGHAFVAKQILKENIYRVIDPDSVEAGHVGPFWYYVPLLAAGLAPWSLFLPGLALFALTPRGVAAPDPAPTAPAAAPEFPPHEVPPAVPRPSADSAGLRAAARPERRRRPGRHDIFVLVWGLVTFALFSLAGSKRAVYLLPAYPAYAMLVARGLGVVSEEGAPAAAGLALLAGATVSAALLAAAFVVLVAAATGLPVDGWLRGLVSNADVANVTPMLEAVREHRTVVIPCALVLAASAWASIAFARRGRWSRVMATTAVAMMALSATASTTLLPALAAKRSARSFLARVSEKVPPGVPLSFYRAFDYGAVFYRGAPIPLRQALTDVPEIDGAWLLTWPAFLPDLVEEARQLDTGGAKAGGYEVEEAMASGDIDTSDRTTLVLVRIVRRIGDEHSDGN